VGSAVCDRFTSFVTGSNRPPTDKTNPFQSGNGLTITLTKGLALDRISAQVDASASVQYRQQRGDVGGGVGGRRPQMRPAARRGRLGDLLCRLSGTPCGRRFGTPRHHNSACSSRRRHFGIEAKGLVCASAQGTWGNSSTLLAARRQKCCRAPFYVHLMNSISMNSRAIRLPYLGCQYAACVLFLCTAALSPLVVDVNV
jgi:hypothetical protein